jgi:hypothetical protein
VRRREFDGVRPGGEEQGSTTDGGWRLRGSGDELWAQVNSGDELRAPVNSGDELRAPVNSGDERQTPATNGTSDERGELEREASSGRQEKGESSATFYREQEGEERSSVLHGPSMAFFTGHRCVSYQRITREEETEALMFLNATKKRTRASRPLACSGVARARDGVGGRCRARSRSWPSGVRPARRDIARIARLGGQEAGRGSRGAGVGAEREQGGERQGREGVVGSGGGWLRDEQQARARSLRFWGIRPLVGRFRLGFVFFLFFKFRNTFFYIAQKFIKIHQNYL